MSDIFRDYSFGGWLKHYRIKRKFTLREFSKLMGVDPSNLSNMENSRLAPPKSKKKIDEFADLLKLGGTERALLYTGAMSYHRNKLIEEFYL